MKSSWKKQRLATKKKQIKRMCSKNNWFIAFSLARAIKSMKKIGEAFRSLGTSARKLQKANEVVE
ncbi:hypothetical protein VNN36_04620 [Lactococcus garvieae]|uniref:hypothetical protein n=1 Tax=Lactococcus garvieae TaxID=1363 RepID=UPI0030D50E93